MRPKLISSKPTGRKWGHKLPEVRKGKFLENDVWEGPTMPGEEGQFFRLKWQVSP